MFKIIQPYLILPHFETQREYRRAQFLKGILVILFVLLFMHVTVDILSGIMMWQLLPLFFAGLVFQIIPYILLHQHKVETAVWVFLASWWFCIHLISFALETHLTLANIGISVTILLISGIIGTPTQTLSFGASLILSNSYFTILMLNNQLEPQIEGMQFTPITSISIILLLILWTSIIFLTSRFVEKILNNLSKSHNELNAMIENVPIGIWYVDLSGKIIRTNHYIQELIGYRSSELIGKKFTDLTHPDDLKKGQKSLIDLINQELTYYETEKRFITKSNEVKEVIVRVNPIKNQFNKPSYFVTAIEDITHRNKTERKLRETENRYEAIYQNTPLIMHIFDQRGNLLEVNNHWIDTIGYSNDEVIGKNLLAFLSPESKKYAAEVCWPEFAENGFITNKEFQFISKTGELIDTLITGLWIEDKTEASSMYGIGFLIDITDLRKTEALLHQSLRLDSLGHLAGGVAHDFNNLLTGAMIQTSLLLRNLPEKSWEAERAKKAMASLDRAAELTNQLLTYVGKSPSDFRHLELNSVIKASHEFLSAGLPPHIDITYHLAQPSLHIKADRSQIQQILHNLIQNSFEALQDNVHQSYIKVSASSMQCDEKMLGLYQCKNPLAPGQYAHLKVEDSGGGMDQKTIEHIFDPFFTTKEAGHGLGMAAILGIVHQHGGGIKIGSELDKGTAVSVIFPQIQSPILPATQIDNKTLDIQNELTGCVLIAEDTPSALEAMVDILESINLTVLGAKDGKEAAELYTLKGTEIDLVILDLQMANQNGIDTFKLIKKANPKQKIIFTSGYQELFKEELKNLTFDAFIQKPFNSQKFLEIVEQLLASSAA